MQEKIEYNQSKFKFRFILIILWKAKLIVVILYNENIMKSLNNSVIIWLIINQIVCLIIKQIINNNPKCHINLILDGLIEGIIFYQRFFH